MKQPEDFFSSKRGNPCLIIAEIGGNHEGNFKKAKKLAQQALDAGADYVKFQIYSAQSIVNQKIDPKRFDHFKKLELTKKQFSQLHKFCNKVRKGSFLASHWDINSFSWYNNLVDVHKVGSGDLTNFPMLELMAKTKKPIIISTGVSNLGLIKKSLDFIYRISPSYKKNKKIAILQCTALYPSKFSDVNLKVIKTLKNKFKLTTGFSDHTIGSIASETAFTLGAEIIEKHFTNSKNNKLFRDHQLSFNKGDLKRFISNLNKINKLLGKHNKEYSEKELKNNYHFLIRRGVYAKKKIFAGEKITKENIETLRPKINTCASQVENIIGKFTKKEILKNEEIKIKFLKN